MLTATLTVTIVLMLDLAMKMKNHEQNYKKNMTYVNSHLI